MTAAAVDALARIDDGDGRAADVLLADVFDRHCQAQARFCLVCGALGDGWECTACVIAAEIEATRREDI